VLVNGNIKALVRKQFKLMHSSEIGALEIGTGTNTEIGVGWDTLFADSVGRLSILQALFKTMSKYLLMYERDVHYANDPDKQAAITLVLDDTPQSVTSRKCQSWILFPGQTGTSPIPIGRYTTLSSNAPDRGQDRVCEAFHQC
jgi:hypothetical protein